MERFVIRGGKPLKGSIKIHGAKNAMLPIMAASILTTERIILHDCEQLQDLHSMAGILEHIGCKLEWSGSSINIDPSIAGTYTIPDTLARELRSSIFLLGSIISRFGEADISYPGGCDIGLRPIDLHLKGLRALGAVITEEFGRIHAYGHNLVGSEIYLDYPSVGATENLMLAAVRAKGKTIIRNVAKEPEIIDLQSFINQMGGKVSGAGTETITVQGVDELHGIEYHVMPDRIAAGTFLIAAAITGGELYLENVRPEHLASVHVKLLESGCMVAVGNDSIHIKGPPLVASQKIIETLPYPGFPTDMQAQMMALQTVCDGTSIIIENIFENRFKHVAELRKMGADITIKDRMAIIRGVRDLMGAEVNAQDLRGGAALVLAGLRARGTTIVNNVHHIDRGYYHLEKSLQALGAEITRI